MKQRITGRVNGDYYEVLGLDGSVTRQTLLSEARENTKLSAAILRNGWEELPKE